MFDLAEKSVVKLIKYSQMLPVRYSFEIMYITVPKSNPAPKVRNDIKEILSYSTSFFLVILGENTALIVTVIHLYLRIFLFTETIPPTADDNSITAKVISV